MLRAWSVCVCVRTCVGSHSSEKGKLASLEELCAVLEHNFHTINIQISEVNMQCHSCVLATTLGPLGRCHSCLPASLDTACSVSKACLGVVTKGQHLLCCYTYAAVPVAVLPRGKRPCLPCV